MGEAIEDIVAFMKGLSANHVAINRNHYVVGTPTLEQSGPVWCYRIGRSEESGEDEAAATELEQLTNTACGGTEAAEMLFPIQGGNWERYV